MMRCGISPKAVLASLVLLLAAAPTCRAERMIIGPGGLLDDLPALEDASVFAISSHDRTGGNNDGFDGAHSALRQEPNGEYVIYEAEGPGALVRQWFTAPDPAQQVRFYFDGEETPRIDIPVRELFSGNTFPFLRPLVGDDATSSGGFYVYLALPYAKSLKVTTADKARFYSFSGIRFNDGRKIDTYDPEWSNADRERLRAICLKLGTLGVDPKESKKEIPVATSGIVPAGGQTEIFNVAGEGVIGKLRINMPNMGDLTWRKVIVRAWWDDMELPAIEVPLCDFFGTGFGPVPERSLATGFASAWAYCYFPMPFRKNARIALVNGADHAVPLFSSEVSWTKQRVPENWGHFHAKWQHTITREGEHYHILEANGPGKFVGDNISMQGRGYSYLEGDEKIYVDGESYPSTHGTGTEDYFMGGWYFKFSVFACPFHGATVKDERRNRISAYRHHIPDAVPFKQSIRVDIEHGPGNNEPNSDYAGAAYWYQQGEEKPFFAALDPATLGLPKTRLFLADDTVLPASAAISAGSGTAPITRPWEVATENYEGGAQVFLDAKAGDWLEFSADRGYADHTAIRLLLTHGPGYGMVQPILNGEPLGNPLDCYGPVIEPAFSHTLPPVALPAGPYTLRLQSLGRGSSSTGSAIGVAGWRLMSQSPFITSMQFAGPFDCRDFNTATDDALPPEAGVNLADTYTGKNGKLIGWRRINLPGGKYDFEKMYGVMDLAVAYAWFRVHSNTDQRVEGMAGSDDSIVVWVNGERMHEMTARRGMLPDDDQFPVNLKAGWNDVLVKIVEEQGDWQFCLRFSDPVGDLQYSADAE